MRVLQTPPRFYPDVGGVETHVHELSRRLVDRGHDVTVVCAETSGAPRREVIDGITVLRVRAPVSIANTDVTPTLPAWVVRLARRVDVVHTHLPTPWSADASTALATAAGTPVVLTYHNDVVGDGIFEFVANLYNATVLRATLRLADRILVTRADYVDRSAHLARSAGKVATVRNGVDVDRFAPAEPSERERRDLGFASDGLNLFFLSVLDEYHEYKGLGVLLNALSGLDERLDRPVRLVVGGDGPLREAYENRARELGVDEMVTFAGYVPDVKLSRAYSGADAFVLPSTSADQEGFGLVALEALACETPVVTTDVVGVAGDVDRLGVGTVVPPADPAALAVAIADVLSPPRDATAGRKLCVERYAWDRAVDDLISVYEAVREGSA